MLRSVLVFLALSLVGCGLAPNLPIVKTCRIDGLGEVKAELAVRCGAVRHNITVARQIMERRLGKDMDSDLFRALFHTLNLTIRDTDVLAGAGGPHEQEIYGAYSFGYGLNAGWIEINRTQLAQLHELYHAYQASTANLDPSTQWHVGWEEKGWFADDTEYNIARVSDLTDPNWSED